MRPGIIRPILVLTVFALLGVLSATDFYVSSLGSPPPVPKFGYSPPPVRLFSLSFSYYLAWAIVMPGIFWLARAVPVERRRWVRALAFHLAVPVAGSIPFFWLRILVRAALGSGELPTAAVLANFPWARVFALQTIAALPAYWLLLGLAVALQLSREYAANQMRAIGLRRSLADAQLDALKMKLQPHFLFNTLNALASFARAGDTEAVVRMVERLGTLLRLSMETSGRQFVTLDEELTLLDAYLSIEEIRFGDRLRIVHRIEPETRHALVPNLILQPLIENAIVHGLSRRLDATLLEIAARRDGRQLHIAVRDDGPGLPVGWNLDAKAGAGLKNVIDRVRGLFPGTGGFEMQNGATGGAVAVLSLPFADAETTALGGDRLSWTASGRSSLTTSSWQGAV